MYEILFTREAQERLAEIAKSDQKSARIIFDHIKRLPELHQNDPFLKGAHFKGLKRNRTGRYRFIYRVVEQGKKIHIITIDFRKSIYA